MTEMSVPFLNRLVDRMFMHADPKADQNLWDLARAAEEVLKETKVEEFFRTGDPTVLGGRVAQDGPPVPVASPTCRMHINPVPLTFSTVPAQGYRENVPDYEAQLGEIEHILVGEPDSAGADLVSRVRAVVNARHEERKRLERAESLVKTADAELQQIGRTELHGSLSQRLIGAIRSSSSTETRLDRAEKLLRILAHTLSPTQAISQDKLLGIAEALMNELTELREKSTEQAQYRDNDALAEDVMNQIRTAAKVEEGESIIGRVEAMAEEQPKELSARFLARPRSGADWGVWDTATGDWVDGLRYLEIGARNSAKERNEAQ